MIWYSSGISNRQVIPASSPKARREPKHPDLEEALCNYHPNPGSSGDACVVYPNKEQSHNKGNLAAIQKKKKKKKP
jgi:hypothetical protein